MPSANTAVRGHTARRLAERYADLAIVASIAAAAASFVALSLSRYHTVHNRTFDLALYARMAWGLVHAEPWDPIVGGNFLGGHKPVALLPLGVLGLVFDTATVLLVAQALALALTAWPLSRAAMRTSGPGAALAVALAWLLYPNVGHVATYEFHPGNLAVLPLSLALDSVARRQPGGLLRHATFALFCRSALYLETLMLGLLGLFFAAVAPGATASRQSSRPAPRSISAQAADSRGLRRAARAVALGSIAYLLLDVVWLRRAFGDASSASLDLHFGPWGGSPFGIVRAAVTQPDAVVEHFLAAERLTYLPRVLSPLFFLPLLAPRWLLPALPALAINLISVFPTATALYSHYLTPALPALFYAAIVGLARLGSLRAWARSGLPLALVGAASIGSCVFGGLPWSRDYARGDFGADALTAQRLAVLRALPPGASVQAPDPLLPHLAERRAVHRAPPPERESDFVVLDVGHRRRYAQRGDLLRTREEPVVRRWLARADHGVVHAEPDYLVLRRGAPPRGGPARRFIVGKADPRSGRRLCACLAVLNAELGADHLALELVARAACPSDLALRLGTGPRPARVDLLFEGLLSPAHLEPGDRLRSSHPLSAAERAAILERGLSIGALRSSGARPKPSDPDAVTIAFSVSGGAPPLGAP